MKRFKCAKIFAVTVIALSFLLACTGSAAYPTEAYINTVGAAIAEAAYTENNGGKTEAGVAAEDVLLYNGFESAEESTLKAILGDDVFINDGYTYYYKNRTYSADGGEILSPIIYAIPYENGKLYQSAAKHISSSNGSETYYTCYGYSYMSYQYIQSGDGYKLITKSNMIMACVIKTVYSLYYTDGNPVTANTTAYWQHDIAPYFDDAASSYLNGVKISENVCIKKLTVIDDGNEICKFTFDI